MTFAKLVHCFSRCFTVDGGFKFIDGGEILLFAAKQADCARIWLEDVENHAYGGRLSGAIWTEQAKYLAGFDGKRNVDDCLQLPKSLSQLGDVY